ncbi:OmpA family protein [Halosquirtibacter laminarini]|uniref:OmpA family protein n=1 Tax=Halosquirtibacter laminarini TaxID=3374600 RepID=A0AC61NDA8_9BACT|nr:OmpA family protein [Prolixibacteraceae bacterium]
MIQYSNSFYRQSIKFGWAILIVFSFCSCQLNSLIKKADRCNQNGEYYKASKLYNRAAQKSKSKQQRSKFYFQTAENQRKIGDFRKASGFYKRAITYKYPDSLLWIKYGDMLCGSGKYEKAIEAYNTFLIDHPEAKEVKEKISLAKQAPKWIESKSRIQIEKLRAINSKGSDISAIYPSSRSNYLVFATNNAELVTKKKSNITGERYYDLCYANYDIQKQRWGKPQNLDPDGIINTQEDEGVPSFASQGSVIYYTQCKYAKNGGASAAIYKSRVDGEQWAKPQRIKIPDDSTMVAHPSVTLDANEIYFVSDRPGGYGGNDIWMSKKEGNQWGPAINLGPQINTTGNEVYPFIRDNGTLYFSSDTHPGIGGLDIFQAIQNEDGIWEVENVRAPLNSSGDDFAITFLAGKEQGLFSSNRKGTRSDDIFSFVIPPMEFTIEGEVLNKNTNKLLTQATIRVIGTDGTMLKLKTRNGKFRFNISKDAEYLLAAYKKGYLNAKYLFNTLDAKESVHLSRNLVLTPTDAPIEVDNIYFDLAKWDLLPASIASLDSLYQVLVDNPTISIEIMAHTDGRGDSQSNFSLSQKRALSVVAFLKAKGIPAIRLSAKGYGKTSPKVIDKKLANKYEFLEVGDTLTMEFIQRKEKEEQEICHQINRRTEFRVLSTNYLKR